MVTDHDPLNPSLEEPTPPELVAKLTRSQRELRVQALEAQSRQIVQDALTYYRRGRTVTARCVLFSGGNDSTTLAHMFRDYATHAVHVDTTVGIQQTRDYVRETCEAWGLPLIVRRPPDSYRDLVLGRVRTKSTGEAVWPGGFPGPGGHAFIYGRLKERALDLVRHDLGVAGSRTECVLWLAGRRRQESDRRVDVPLYESDGTVIWASPLALWTKLDLNTYRLMHGDVPRCQASDLIHMSGECLCGSFAKPGELEEIRAWFPETAAMLDQLQEEVRAAGLVREPWAVWGHGLKGRGRAKVAPSGRLCSSCALPPAAQTETEELSA